MSSMKAVVFRGPFDIGVELRPKPQIKDASDAIIRVKLAGICGTVKPDDALQKKIQLEEEFHDFRSQIPTALI
ncbi:hypothetical protein N7540_005526 [Penicillium herquei]|nr:hypothetical protein N7540_005526 [Penicillium herquei]